MKYKTWVALKNQFIFNVMITPLNRASLAHVTEQALVG